MKKSAIISGTTQYIYYVTMPRIYPLCTDGSSSSSSCTGRKQVGLTEFEKLIYENTERDDGVVEYCKSWF